MLFLGLDPGLSGGITVIDGGSVAVHPMPGDEDALWDLIGSYKINSVREYGSTRLTVLNPSCAVIEKVGGFVKGNPTPGSAMFTFGVSYGQLRMALVAAGIPFVAVTPQRWQDEFGMVRGKTEKKYTFKSRLVAKARELYPAAKIARDPADSVLLAEFCKRHHKQLFPSVS